MENKKQKTGYSWRAPITSIIDWWTMSDTARFWMRLRPSMLGLAALEFARGEIGNGETTGNNRGEHIDVYRGEIGGHGAWCAAFVSWCLVEASKKTRINLGLKPSNGARKLFRRAVKRGMLVCIDDIKPGDIVLWSRGKTPATRWQAHIGIVSEVERDDDKVLSWRYIAGNEGRFPAKVHEHKGHSRRLVGFARV